jgi:hypothetical protein
MMMNLLPTLPPGNEFGIYMICMLVGFFVVFMHSLDQFDKPVSTKDDDPSKFIDPSYMTPPRQYMFGFFVYCGLMNLIFLAISLVGPDRLTKIATALGWTPDPGLQGFATFPIVIAFVIVGLHPSLKLPKSLDFETIIRRFGQAVAYIPKNLNEILDTMRFSKFSPSPQIVAEAWKTTPLHPIVSDSAVVERALPLLEKAMVLYARASTLSGERNMGSARALSPYFNLDVFRQYREQLHNVFVSLQAIHGRIAIEISNVPDELKEPVQDIERDLIKNIEFLYVIFAAAITAKGADRVSERLRTLDFEPTNVIRTGVPWQPILKVASAAAAILLIAMLTAQWTVQSAQSVLPPQAFDLLVLLGKIMLVNTFSVAQAMRFRTRYILSEDYFSPESGYGQMSAYGKIFLICGLSSWLFYLVLSAADLLGQISQQPNAAALQVLWNYFDSNLIWSLVPGLCGVTAAISLDRPSNTHLQRGVSALITGGAMGGGAVLVGIVIARLLPSLAGDPASFIPSQIFYFAIYACLGCVYGAILPAEIRRYRAAEEKRLPDRISVLRTAVFQYFYDIQQFQDWLNSYDSNLEGRRPLDVLGEDSGLQRLTDLVIRTKVKIVPSALVAQSA